MARLNEVTEMIRDIFMIGSILEVLRNLMINCINIFYGVIENPWEHLEEKVLFSFWKRSWRRDRRFMKSFFVPLRSTSKDFIKHCTLSLASFHPMGHIYWQRRKIPKKFLGCRCFFGGNVLKWMFDMDLSIQEQSNFRIWHFMEGCDGRVGKEAGIVRI